MPTWDRVNAQDYFSVFIQLSNDELTTTGVKTL